MSEKADDDGGLSPTEEENAFWQNLDRRGLKVLIKKQYTSYSILFFDKKQAPAAGYFAGRGGSAYSVGSSETGSVGAGSVGAGSVGLGSVGAGSVGLGSVG